MNNMKAVNRRAVQGLGQQLDLFYNLGGVFKNKQISHSKELIRQAYSTSYKIRNLLFEVGGVQATCVKRAIGAMHRPEYLGPKWSYIAQDLRGENIKGERKWPTTNALKNLLEFAAKKLANGEDGQNAEFLQTSVKMFEILKELDNYLVLGRYEKFDQKFEELQRAPENSVQIYIAIRIDMFKSAQRIN